MMEFRKATVGEKTITAVQPIILLRVKICGRRLVVVWMFEVVGIGNDE